MTREEVKAQLAKCPLEWEETIYPDEIVTTAFDISEGVKIQYTILGNSLGVRGVNYDSTLFGMCLYPFGGEDPKSKAEAHRTDLICGLLGIND